MSRPRLSRRGPLGGPRRSHGQLGGHVGRSGKHGPFGAGAAASISRRLESGSAWATPSNRGPARGASPRAPRSARALTVRARPRHPRARFTAIALGWPTCFTPVSTGPPSDWASRSTRGCRRFQRPRWPSTGTERRIWIRWSPCMSLPPSSRGLQAAGTGVHVAGPGRRRPADSTAEGRDSTRPFSVRLTTLVWNAISPLVS